MRKSKSSLGAYFLFAFLIPLSGFAAGLSADEILKRAENIRNPDRDYEVMIKLVDKNSKGEDVRTYKSKVKGRDKAVVQFLTPETERGTTVLMVEDQMWMAMPNTQKPIRISAQQRVVGNAAYGDLLRLSFLGNYSAKLLPNEKVGPEEAFALDLTAVDGKLVTYEKVKYWVSQKTYRPLKATYMTPGGKVIREAYFEKYSKMLDQDRPTLFRFVDAIRKNQETFIYFANMKGVALPEALFDRQNLGRL